MSPFFLSFCLFPSHAENRYLFLRSLFLKSTPTLNYSVCVWASLVSVRPPHLNTLESGDISHAQPRDAKNGDSSRTEALGQPPNPTPPPSAPPDGFITSYAAHLKPIESLGGQECLTQLSTSEGVSATLGNCWLGFGVVFVVFVLFCFVFGKKKNPGICIFFIVFVGSGDP